MMIFVFGSNLAGRHGKGAALHARKEFGALYGRGEGYQGSAYAIPTKGYKMEVLPLEKINDAVQRFIDFARARPHLQFQVTPIGCGLAGYKAEQISPMFEGAPENCVFEDENGRDWRTGLDAPGPAAK